MCQALRELMQDEIYQSHQEGLMAGRQEGRRAGESRLAKLISALLLSGREQDVAKAAEDPEYRERLYAEFGIA